MAYSRVLFSRCLKYRHTPTKGSRQQPGNGGALAFLLPATCTLDACLLDNLLARPMLRKHTHTQDTNNTRTHTHARTERLLRCCCGENLHKPPNKQRPRGQDWSQRGSGYLKGRTASTHFDALTDIPVCSPSPLCRATRRTGQGHAWRLAEAWFR